MPRDSPAPPAAKTLPVWLSPSLLRLLADGIAADTTRGIPHHVVKQTAHERARALRPAMPMPDLAEAVALALWIARWPGASRDDARNHGIASRLPSAAVIRIQPKSTD
jgi:hypothetical protein